MKGRALPVPPYIYGSNIVQRVTREAFSQVDSDTGNHLCAGVRALSYRFAMTVFLITIVVLVNSDEVDKFGFWDGPLS
jgi:hypothetical protein